MTGNSKAWLGGFGELGHPVDVASIPSGIIVMWSGASNAIPTGWLLCNGSNGTPDLRDRFIVGAGSNYTVGATGGETMHTLTIKEMPSHSHYIDGASSLSGSRINAAVLNVITSKYYMYTDSAGGDQPHENRSPYYALCFIMKN